MRGEGVRDGWCRGGDRLNFTKSVFANLVVLVDSKVGIHVLIGLGFIVKRFVVCWGTSTKIDS